MRGGFGLALVALAASLTFALPARAQAPAVSPSAVPTKAPIVEPSALGDPWTPDEVAALQRDVDAMLAGSPALRGTHAGVLLTDTRTGATLYARSADDEFQPASTFPSPDSASIRT